MKIKFIIGMIVLIVFVSGCDVYDTLYSKEQKAEEKHSDGIDWSIHSQGFYYDCVDEWDYSAFEEFVDGTGFDNYVESSSPFSGEIVINENLIYFIDLELLRNMSQQKNEAILCGKLDIESTQYYREPRISNEQVFDMYSTGDCNPYAEDNIDSLSYKIVCCVDNYCYKHFTTWEYEDEIEYDYTFSDSKSRKCKVNITSCDEI